MTSGHSSLDKFWQPRRPRSRGRPSTKTSEQFPDAKAGPSREEIEIFLSFDGLGNVYEDWHGYLVTTIKNFVLSTSDPPGSVDANTAAWLVSALSDARPRSATAIIRAVLTEARHIDEVLEQGFPSERS